jgi:hypothetical protein
VRRRLLCAAAFAILTACTNGMANDGSRTPDMPVSSRDPAPQPQPQGPTRDCPISSSSDWAAWVNAMPGPNARPTLIVTGKVTLPSGGHRVSLHAGPVLELYPPIQQVLLKAVAPTGEGTPEAPTLEVRVELPALDTYGEVHVRCGNRTLATIRNIERAY